jgi:dTDP-4-amino-4,6-dideoxygalactose transaminase
VTGLGQIPFLRPEVPPLEAIAPYFRISEEARYFSNGGPCSRELAARLGAVLDDVRCVLVSNCTIGLMLALRAAIGMPVPTRSLVVMPSFTFPAAACAVVWAGFAPLFVDVDPESWQLDPARLGEALARHDGGVAGVLAGSTFGTPAPPVMRAEWRRLCAEHDVPLIVDSAAGFGATNADGRRLGTLGDTEVFSFHATKPFAIGEGGMVATPDQGLADEIARLLNFGFGREPSISLAVGLNGKLSELHAATGLAALDRYDTVLQRRRSAARELLAALGRGVERQAGCDGSTWQFVPVLVATAAARDHALDAAGRGAVHARRYFSPPLHVHPAFAAYRTTETLEQTERIAARSLSLPLVFDEAERKRVAQVVASTVNAC